MILLFKFVCLLLAAQLVSPFVTVALAYFFGRKSEPLSNPRSSNTTRSFACIITAYRNADIAQPLIQSLLAQTYANLDVYLVADECPDFDFSIQDERLHLLRPPSPLRLKVKSILYAMEHFRARHDYVVIFDADNLAHPQFLEAINSFADAGFQCIQGQRMAKNLDTSYAALDSLGEHYKNYIEREVPFLLGASAVISGSGMATETGQYQAYLQSPEIEQGKQLSKKMLQEDKILQNFLLRQNLRIAYARQAIVYDEKVETGAAVETQRSRWLFSYFQNIPNAVGLLWLGLLNGSFNPLYFGWITLALPMFIQLGLAMIFLIFAFFIAPNWSLVLMGAMVVFGLNLLWVLYLDDAPAIVRRIVWQAPKFVLRQLISLFKMRDPNKHFKHTEHRKKVSVDELLRQKSEIDPNA